MKKDTEHFQSIAQLFRELALPAPSHPLIALVDYQQLPEFSLEAGRKISLDFYKISFKPNYKGKTRYGQGYYDFEDGGLAFLKPQQVVFSPEEIGNYEGLALYFHPDLIRNTSLGNVIHQYGFFSYDVSEALLLSAKEKAIIANLFTLLSKELDQNIDRFSEPVLIAQLALLLSYSNRFYERQFFTRKTVNHNIITALDRLLNQYFIDKSGRKNGLPSVQNLCSELGVSQRYLSDMLRSLTGLNTQQYIQNTVIEKAKEKLSSSALSVKEIAYELGFEHPQSFSKLFKSKTNQSPLEFRAGFN